MIVFFFFFLSGAAGLLYEVIWLRMLILIFGSTQFAVGTILTAFMGGLALGSFLFGRIIDRREDPLRLYGLLEIGIGLYALAVPFLFDALVPIYRFIWRSFEPGFFSFSLLRFCFISLILIVPTSLMGGTLPILSKFVTRREERIGVSVGSLYAVNTFGAVIGTAVTGFLLLPVLGTRNSIMLAATLNLAIGLTSVFLARKEPRAVVSGRKPEGEAVSGTGSVVPMPAEARLLLWIIAGTGFVALMYEIAWTRVLSLIIGSSVYAFTIMLTTFLVGLAVGAIIVARISDRLRGRYAIEGLIFLLTGTAVTAFGTLLLFNGLPYRFARLYHGIGENGAMIFILKFAMSFAVMLVPTMFMGGVFPLVMRYCSERLSLLGRSVGIVYASNTAGTILGSFLTGFFLIPLIGIQSSILLAIMLDLLLAILLVVGVTKGMRRVTGWSMGRRAAAAMVLILLGTGIHFGAPGWDTLVLNSGVYQYANDLEEKDLTPDGFFDFTSGDFELKYYKEGMTTTVMIVLQKSSNSILLMVNGKIDASSIGDMPTQLLSGHLPTLLVGRPRKALIIGYASGITVGAVAQHPYEEITAVEIEEAILEASRYFDGHNHRPLEKPNVRVVRNDGRNYLLVNEEKYDVIISEPSNPWMTIAANLFTKEFFELGRARLSEGGVFAQWLQIYGMFPEDVKALVRTFHSVFPHVMVFNTIEDSDLVLMGSERPLTFDLEDIGRRMSELPVAVDLKRIEITTPQDMLSYFVFGDEELEALAGPGPINTDDNALIEFHAPKSLHTETREANVAEIKKVTVDPTKYVAGLEDPARRRAHEVAQIEAFLRREKYDRARELSRSRGVRERSEAGKAAESP